MSDPTSEIDQAFAAALELHRAGRFDEAVVAYRRVLDSQPDHARALHSLGVLEKHLGRHESAVELISRAIALHPGAAEFHNNLGDALQTLCRDDDALRAFAAAIQLAPDYVKAYNNLGTLLSRMGRHAEAVDVLSEALARQPNYARAMANLAAALVQCGRQAQAIDCYRRALALEPDYATAHHGLLMALHYAEHDPADLFAAHRRWAERYADPLTAAAAPHANDRDPDRPLRIGYVSGDFKDHAVATFFAPVLEHHDGASFHVTCYSNAAAPDAVTAHLRSHADAWRDIAPLTDDQAAQLIRDDRIDLLIDLSGHSARHRALLMARRSAPVQATWLGYPDTTGMRAVDFRLTDAVSDPPGMTERFHVEQLVRLRSCWCYRAWQNAPPVAPPPAASSPGGAPTFGSFNTLAKVTPEVLELWSRVLREFPASRLLIKAAAAGDERVRESLRRRFEQHGVERSRVELLGREPDGRKHAEAYARVDVMLDTYPYHGTTMTCEALWMGVPVVTLAGPSHVSRVGASLLTTVALPQLIATSREDYVTRAVALARDVPSLIELRRTMRQRMLASPLLDAPGFTRDLEAAYRDMWRGSGVQS